MGSLQLVATSLRPRPRLLLHVHAQDARERIEGVHDLAFDARPLLARDAEDLDVLQLSDATQAADERSVDVGERVTVRKTFSSWFCASGVDIDDVVREAHSPPDAPLHMAHTPDIDDTIPLASQVGGHPGVRTSEDGSLLIKPALPREVAFYQALMSDPALAELRPYVPRFYGTLRLEGKVDESAPGPEQGGQLKVVEAAVAEEEKDEWLFEVEEKESLTESVVVTQSLVLENVSHAFAKPNILDIKLGTILYDDEASEEKRARMEKTARETTSLETGVRLTGFQVYDLVNDKPINTPKSYGKSITASDLPDGIARFFPIASASAATTAGPSAPADAASAQGTGLPADVLAPLLETLREDIAEIRDALADAELRMVGASLLIVYEADWERARAGLQWLEEGCDEDEAEDEDEEESEEEGGKKRVGPPYMVKLIDFAHTKQVPGAGPDEGVLKGVDTVLRLLDGRIEQVKTVAAAEEKSKAKA
ncbi:hypothetical protein ACG7TL_002307 [Trametes sanguinea]